MSESIARGLPSQRRVVAAIGGVSLGIFLLDSFFPLGFVIPALYLLPVILTIRVSRAMAPFVMALCATGLTLVGIWTGWTASADLVIPGLFNRSLVITACWIAAALIWHMTQKHARRELEALVSARTAALRQSESTLESFFNSTDLMMGVVDIIEGNPVMVMSNRAAANAARPVTENRTDLPAGVLSLVSHSPDFWIPHFEAARRTGQTVRVTSQFPSMPKTALSDRTIASAVSFIGLSAGGTPLYAWIGEDITEQMQISQNMEANRRSLEVSQTQLRQLTAKLLSAQDDERRRIARELHDELNQRVISLAFEIDDRLQQMPDLPAAARTTLHVVKNEVAELSDQLRDLAHRLHPSVLEDLGVASALRGCAREFEQREHIRVHLTIEESHTPLHHHLAECLFRVTQEALRNVAKHAGAKQVSLALTYQDNCVMLRIEDDGRGFTPQDRENVQRGLGLVSMGERVRLLAGSLALTSNPGCGTSLSVSIPLTGISNEQAAHLSR
jgi:signal transduction histidine kinase